MQCTNLGRSRHAASAAPLPAPPSFPVNFAGYAATSRPRHSAQRATAQSQGDHGRAAAAGAHRHHRPLGVRARARWRSTRSTRRVSAATSSRCPPTPSSSSSGCPSRWWIPLEGLSPAVAIEQKNPTTSSRSTVGTATEIYDFLRLLWARVGTPYCRHCGAVVKVDTVEEVVDAILATGASAERPQPVLISFPLPESAHRPDVDAAAQLVAAGFVRAQVDGAVLRLDEPEADRRVRAGREVLVIVDRVAPTGLNRGRLVDAVGTAFTEGEGVAVALANGSRRRFSSHPTCSTCGQAAPTLTPDAVLLQQPARRLPGLQRVRGGARVRRVAHRPGARDDARPGRPRPVDQAALRGPPPPAAGDGPRPRHPRRPPLAGPRPAPAAVPAPRRRRRRTLSGRLSVSRAARDQTVQAVHPGLPAPVPAGQDLPGLRRRPA